METPSLRSSYDVVIVGARVAGAATALQMARRGLRVLAVERSLYGSDTLSTLALMRAGVLQLRRWGVLESLDRAGARPIRTTTFHYGDEDAFTVELQERDGIDSLRAPRRTVLDRLLVDAAREAGAHVVHGARVTELVHEGARVRGVVVEDRSGRSLTIRADLVVGADGVGSTVARGVSAETLVEGRHRSAAAYGLWRGPGPEGSDFQGYGWYYRPGTSAGVIPTTDADGTEPLTLVFASVPSREFARLRGEAGVLDVLKATDADLAKAVESAERVGVLRAFPGRNGYVRRSHGRGWALVGDAAYFKDPITAHGISDALRDAELLAVSYVHHGEPGLERYQRTRDELSRPLFEITDRIASFDWDLPTVQQWHVELSREMNREVEAMLQWTATEPPLAAAS